MINGNSKLELITLVELDYNKENESLLCYIPQQPTRTINLNHKIPGGLIITAIYLNVKFSVKNNSHHKRHDFHVNHQSDLSDSGIHWEQVGQTNGCKPTLLMCEGWRQDPWEGD